MRALLALALLLAVCVPATAAPASLEFAGLTFFLKNDQSDEDQVLREYLPKGQTFDDYSHLLAVRRDPLGDLAEYAGVLERNLTERYPGSTFQVLTCTKDTLVLEFVIVSDQGQEYNLWHYRNTAEGRLSVQFVVRDRGALASGFDEALEDRPEWQAELRKVAPRMERLVTTP